MPEMLGSPCFLRALLVFLWNSILLFPCATAERFKTFLPKTTNKLQCGIECPQQTFHMIAKVLEIAGDKEHLHEWTRWCNSRPSKLRLKQQIWNTMLPGELYSEGWWATYYHIPLLHILKILPQNRPMHHLCKCPKDFSDLIPCACK